MSTFSQSEPIGRGRLVFLFYLLFTAAAELVTAAVDAQAGMIMHFVLLFALLFHSALGAQPAQRKLALGLTLAPLIRLISLGLPLGQFPQVTWYPLVAIPLLCASWVIARQIGASRADIGLRLGNPWANLGLAGGGVLLGAIEYAILRPAPLLSDTSWYVTALSMLSLTIFTGFLEELIFRGLLQSAAQAALGRWAIPFVALLFGVLHIGYLSAADVVFVTLVGLLFAQIVRKSGSIAGVTIAHGVTNITLFVLMPSLLGAHGGSGLPVAAGALLVGVVLVVAIGAVASRTTVLARQAALNDLQR